MTIPDYIDHLRRAGFVVDDTGVGTPPPGTACTVMIIVWSDENIPLTSIILRQSGDTLRRFFVADGDPADDVTRLHRLETAREIACEEVPL